MNVTLGQILTENGEVSSSSISSFGVGGMDPPEGDMARTTGLCMIACSSHFATFCLVMFPMVDFVT